MKIRPLTMHEDARITACEEMRSHSLLPYRLLFDVHHGTGAYALPIQVKVISDGRTKVALAKV